MERKSYVGMHYSSENIDNANLPIKETIYDDRRVIERLSGDLREVTQTVRDNIELEFAEKLSNNLAEGEELIAKI